MFAGEHTTPYHPSTIHGAFLSGIREAYRLDLFMEPKLNDYMVFEANEKIYQHTFPVRRSKPRTTVKDRDLRQSPKASAITSQIAAPTRRRRQVAGMVLRKQPKTIVETTAVGGSKKPVGVQANSPSRRSVRSLSRKKIDQSEPTHDDDMRDFLLDKKRQIDDLEDRILLRSLDSYGRDVGILRSKIRRN